MLQFGLLLAASAAPPRATLMIMHTVDPSNPRQPFALSSLDISTGKVVKSMNVSMPEAPCDADPQSPCWMVQNNNYDVAVGTVDNNKNALYFLQQHVNQIGGRPWLPADDCGGCAAHATCCKDPPSGQEHGVCLKVADCTKFGPGQHTNYSAPKLLRVDPTTAVVQIVGELPEANDRHALTSANYHLGFDPTGFCGSVLATYRKYDVPPPPTSGSPVRTGVARINASTGHVTEEATLAVECINCVNGSWGTMVISENGAFGQLASGASVFCDEAKTFGSASRFSQYLCWDVRTGAVVANVTDHHQLTAVHWDAAKNRLVGLGVCCSGVDGCPPECSGRAYNRTFVAWDPTGAAPKTLAFVDPLPDAATGATWLPLGAALDATARVYSYVAVAAAQGSTITLLRFVHIDADTGTVLGANDWDPAPGDASGAIWRFAYG